MNNPGAAAAKQGTASDISKRAVALFQFASLAVMTQGVLLLNQLVLLPIQVRVWGTNLSAYWYSVVAFACITGVADFGLRTAGHAELLRWTHDPNDREAKREFTHLWAWMRILIASATVILVVTDFIFVHFWLGQDYPLFRLALVLGIACEVILGVRIGYLDTQGYYRQAEAGYLILAAVRFVLALGALLIFKAAPTTLAWIWLLSGIFSIFQQNRLCRRVGKMQLLEPLPPDLSIRFLSTLRYTTADPVASWMRMQLPIVILSSIAQPVAIVVYVALRAIFGLARQTTLQLSRFASVEYLSLRQVGKEELAEIHLTAMVLVSAFISSSVTVLVLVDNCRLASLWIKQLDPHIYRIVAMSFGLGNAFYTYQIAQAVSRRAGELVNVARRQYYYMTYGGIFAVIALVVHSLLLWMVLLLVADIMLALSYMLRPPANSILTLTSSGRRGCMAGFVNGTIICLMVLIMHVEKFSFLRGITTSDALCTIAFFLFWILVIGMADLSLFLGLRFKNMSLQEAVLEWVRRMRRR